MVETSFVPMDFLTANKELLDEKKPQTTYKIEYHCPIFPTAASRRSLDRFSVPMWPITLSGRLPIVGLVGRCPTNYLIGRELIHIR